MDYIFQDTTVSLLIGFIEQAESNALLVAQQHGVNALRDNPDSMGTSLDMLRRGRWRSEGDVETPAGARTPVISKGLVGPRRTVGSDRSPAAWPLESWDSAFFRQAR